MRWNLLLVTGMGFLASLAVLPEGEQPTGALQARYDRGFNEGYQCATRLALNAAESRRLGEYYFDTGNQRLAFRWYCDEAEAVRRSEANAPSTAVPEPPPRRVSQLSIDAELADEYVPRRRAG